MPTPGVKGGLCSGEAARRGVRGGVRAGGGRMAAAERGWGGGRRLGWSGAGGGF